MDWLLTVPLLLIELILMIKMTKKQTVVMSWSLGLAAAAMVGLGYHGEIQDDLQVRWFWWPLAMVPFVFVVAILPCRADERYSRQRCPGGAQQYVERI